MDPTLNIKHATGSYSIHIGSDLIDRAGELVADVIEDKSRLIVLMDENVQQYFQRLETALSRINADSLSVECLTIPAGESSKSLEQLQSIWNQLLKRNCDRNTVIVAFGGGVTGDLAGFVAATYLRGIRFVQIPTTLLSQVDSSVGGKTGINMPSAKNSVGAFWQPQTVIIDPTVLATLEPKEYTSGLAEVVKYGVIMDESFFEFLESNAVQIRHQDMPTLEKLINRCCQLKAQVVEEDERETSGRRAILNYGHTFGHAIESVFGYGTYTHGRAVATGMNVAAILSKLLGRVDRSFVDRQAALLSKLDIPYRFPEEHHKAMFDAMKHDKKAKQGQIRFILPSRFGHVDLVSSIDRDLVLDAMSLACQATE